MKIVGVAACTAGIAHTYIAREKLMKAAEAAGHEIHVETQGNIGAENKLTAEQVKNADIVIIAADIKISGKDRFKGKPTIEVPTDLVVHSSKGLIAKAEEVFNDKKVNS